MHLIFTMSHPTPLPFSNPTSKLTCSNQPTHYSHSHHLLCCLFVFLDIVLQILPVFMNPFTIHAPPIFFYINIFFDFFRERCFFFVFLFCFLFCFLLFCFYIHCTMTLGVLNKMHFYINIIQSSFYSSPTHHLYENVMTLQLQIN